MDTIHHKTRVLITGTIIFLFLVISGYWIFERVYKNRLYPAVSVAAVQFGGKISKSVEEYLLDKNVPFKQANFAFTFEGKTATISGAALNLGYDATLSATQAYQIGRSGHVLSDLYVKFGPTRVNLLPYFRWDEDTLDTFIDNLAVRIDIPVADALFRFDNGRVAAFRPSKRGRQVNKDLLKQQFKDSLTTIDDHKNANINFSVPITILEPTFTTADVNSFGIKELIGRGYSEFAHSIPGRIHNVALAAARLNGILIKPGEIFSFNNALGDVSDLTGFQPAYVIKEGKTVLGDGGGVCQVSTTLFRAALAAGLPIIERHAHAYRVGYYEQAGYKAGIDATVFAPSVDLKIKNDTPGYILIQTKVDTNKLSLIFELFGTGDGRSMEISNHKVWAEVPPPPDLYQDDPTLKTGVVKQVDFAAWGAKANFHYRVTRGGQVLQDTDFFSTFRPWQAVYLRGAAQ